LLPLFITCLLLGPALNTRAEGDETQARAQLEQLKLDMAALSEELKGDKSQRESLQAALRKSEIAIGELQKDIQLTRRKLKRNETQLKDLQEQRRELLVARGTQQELITRELQMAYQMGRQGQLKILLNQEQPDTLARAMAYYQYFYDARNAHIEKYLEILARIDVLEPEITSTTRTLRSNRKMLDQQRQQLLVGKKQRERDLTKINAGIKSKDQRLRKMASDRKELERLLEVIEEAIAELQVPADYQAFTGRKGAMPWPVKGKPSNRFGRRRSGSKMKWQGLTIPAREGSTVTAIHHGRVVFADWFRGSGLLLIIDHGDGYMSLYAHNQALLREVGEWVNAGAAVSTVGNSGGQANSALYFEIRKDGKPTNPTPWLGRG
jgi:septal ring factor EnvC (AmiA/AmiB activator)